MNHPGTVGIYSPGDMGEAVGRVLSRHGARVIAALDGRSARTRELTAAAGIEDVGTEEEMVRQADLLLSILVPAQAEAAAGRIARAMKASASFPLYVDCNAIAAETSRRLGGVLSSAGAAYVDASIIGPPPRKPGATRFYASGGEVSRFAEWKRYGLDIRVLDGPLGQASAFKTCYAALTKGLQALGGEVFVSAQAQGMTAPLLEEFRLSQPGLHGWLEKVLPAMPPKAHRFIGEMEEHAKGFASQGLTPKIMEGAAEFYRLVSQSSLGRETPEEAPRRELEEIAAALAQALESG